MKRNPSCISPSKGENVLAFFHLWNASNNPLLAKEVAGIWLYPYIGLSIVRADQIIELVPERFASVRANVKQDGAPITFISGASATSDIELSRMEGVHGPRRLEVIICLPGERDTP